MIGSDFLDALSSGYASACVSLRKRMVAVAYLGLMSLIDGEKANLSLLFDHVYILKSDAEANIIAQPALLPDLAMSTPIVDQLKDRVNAGDARAKPLFAYLETFPAKPRHPSKKKLDKKKADEVHGDAGEVHVHRMSLVSQVQDLFPDLGARFIVRLLDEYGDNVEELTAHLLEDSFPTHLKEADRGEKFAPIPKYTPYIPHTRRNIHDDDPLATLSVPSSSVHRGRRDGSLTADALLQSAPSAPQKAAILSALAAFDPADDEHDDTYDADDDNVDGTVDATSAGQDADVNDEALFHTYARSPGVFERDAATRRSQGRNTLKAETGMTDEAIEGWAVMILRDPRRLSRLEARFSTFTGAQRELSGSAWREGDETADRGRGRGKGRGGRGRGRGRGDAAGPAGGRDTQIARQRKETGKGGRANHNRREGRAKKMARGGFGPS
ncbi:MAG: hypothetical protein M1832_003477 [Thelocarpon impressellum]|nr:MAG: hypothetical protein M1832_003477 [Thelocarpon impressellum]